MKVNVANVANRQVADPGDLASLLTGDEHASFASLLDLGGNETAAIPGVDGSHGKQGNRPKSTESNKDQRSVPRDTRASASTSSLRPQTLPNIAVAPWKIESGDFNASGESEDASRSPSGADATSDALAVRPGPPVENVRMVDARTLNHQQVFDEKPAEMTPLPDLSDPESGEPLKGSVVENQNAVVTRAVAPPNGTGMDPAIAQPSVTLGVDQPSDGLVDNGTAALGAQGEVGLRLAGISAAQNYATSNHDAKFDGVSQNLTVSVGGRPSDPSVANGGGQVRSATPSQSVVDAASSPSTAADRHSQGNAGDTHRGSSEAKQAISDARFTVPQATQSGPLSALGSNASLHGHSALMKSNHPESVPEPATNAQVKEATTPRAGDADVARYLESAMRGDLRVGVHTEAFGRVTIQTTAQGGQLSAQLSLENAKESATLAAHLPGVEQKIVQQHGLTASVRLVGGFDGGAGAGSAGRDQSGSARRDPERYIATRSGQIEHDSSNEYRGVEPTLIGSRQFVSSRLDVTV